MDSHGWTSGHSCNILQRGVATLRVSVFQGIKFLSGLAHTQTTQTYTRPLQRVITLALVDTCTGVA